jgi:leader peptidase (prepilin peptidase) / N-methyltransferase
MLRIVGTAFAALLGLAFGSFLNVCLSRWPAAESVVRPRSHCRHCGHTLTWWENVPVASWLALRGRCRGCGEWIGWRYPVVEAAVAALWATAAWRVLDPLVLGPLLSAHSVPAAIYIAISIGVGNFILYWLLIALATLDAEHLWLPDWITLNGAGIGFLFVLARGTMLGEPGSMRFAAERTAFGSILGILAAAGLILLIRLIYWLIRRREGIGLGDAKLMAMLAAWLGFPGAMLAFVLGATLGAVVALAIGATGSGRKDGERWALMKLPLGTFLCVGGIVSALWGQPIIAAYLRWAGF